MDEWTCGFQRSPQSLGVRLRGGLGLGNHSNKKASHSETATCNRVQVFYGRPDYDSDDSDESWVEDLEPPSLLSRAFKAMKRKSKQNAAIEVYKSRSDDDYEKFYIAKVHFDIRPLRDAINGVLKPDSFTLRYLDDDTFESTAPHSALYFARHQISELAKMSDDDEVRSRCALLRDVIQEIFLDTFKEIAELNKEGVITFDLLWTLFPPGEIFATRPLTSGHPIETARVKTFRQDSWRATFENETVGFSGFCFTNRNFRYTMPSFHGKIELSRMNFGGRTYLNLDEDNGKLREELIARGRKILDFQTARYMMYTPEPAGDQEATNPWVAEKTQQRVVCDYYMQAKLPPEPPSPPVMNPKGGNPVRPMPPPPKCFESQLLGYKDTTMTSMRSCRPTQAEVEINCRVLTESEDNLLLMCPYVPSYNLDTNTWFDADIDRLEPIIETGEVVFDRVTYDEEKKEVLKTLVENHRQCGGDQDDLISRKGQALVILLEGWHGTGKKHIVKALAEQLGCPLMRGFEQNLAIYPNMKFPILLEQAAEWGALLLFDDPDFLSLYSSRPMGMPGHGFWKVQDFLRHVETFKGIIFLATTRQTRDINTTILSRADAHLSFPVFDEELRKQVWEKFLNRLPEDTGLRDSLLSPEELSTTLAKWVMNGRQIRNIVNLSTSWCRQMKCPLDLDVIKKMISTTCPTAFEATDDSGTDDETVQNDLAVRPTSAPRWGPPPPLPPGIAWHASSPSSKKKKNKKNNEEQQT